MIKDYKITLKKEVQINVGQTIKEETIYWTIEVTSSSISVFSADPYMFPGWQVHVIRVI